MQNPLAPIEVLATNAMFCDPAIDQTDADESELPPAAERIEQYRKTRLLSALVFVPDVKPTLFVCKLLSASTAAKLLDGMATQRAWLSAFVLGCHEIRLPDGTTMRPAKMTAGANGTSAPADENRWIDEVSRKFGLETVYEVGSVIYERARLPEGAQGPFFYRAG